MAKSKTAAAKNGQDCSILFGDCVQQIPKAVEKGSVDLVVVDPPYNIGYDAYENYNDDKSSEEYVGWCREWLQRLEESLRPGGALWLVIGDEFASELDVLCRHELGLQRRSWVVWYYTFGVACATTFSRSHTHLFYYVKRKGEVVFNAESPALRVPSARQLVYNDKRANRDGKLPDNTWVLSPLDLSKAFGPAEDTWIASRVCGTFRAREDRGTYGKSRGIPQLPAEIVNRIVIATSRPGDLVLDPMVGTGTTAEVAVLTGRRFVGIDNSKKACELSRSRADRAARRVAEVAAAGRSKEDSSNGRKPADKGRRSGSAVAKRSQRVRGKARVRRRATAR